MKKRILVSIALVLAWSSVILAQETVNPSGRPVTIRYALSASSLTVADTLIITRTVVNKASYTLGNLFLSDNLPSQFQVVSSVARVNGSTVTIGLSGPFAGQIQSGYNAFRWVLDSPVSGETWNRVLNPNDSLSLQIKVVCSATGNYTLPFHSTVCYGSGSGIFSTANSSAVTFTSAVDTTPPAAIMDLGDATDYSEGTFLTRCSAAGPGRTERYVAG